MLHRKIFLFVLKLYSKQFSNSSWFSWIHVCNNTENQENYVFFLYCLRHFTVWHFTFLFRFRSWHTKGHKNVFAFYCDWAKEKKIYYWNRNYLSTIFFISDVKYPFGYKKSEVFFSFGWTNFLRWMYLWRNKLSPQLQLENGNEVIRITLRIINSALSKCRGNAKYDFLVHVLLFAVTQDTIAWAHMASSSHTYQKPLNTAVWNIEK